MIQIQSQQSDLDMEKMNFNLNVSRRTMAVWLALCILIFTKLLVGKTEETSVCSTITSHSQPHDEVFTEFYRKIFYMSCGDNNENACQKYRHFYRLNRRTVYTTTYRISYVCCKGWAMQDGVCKPICTPKCSNGQQCTRPNACAYPPKSDSYPAVKIQRRSTSQCSKSVRAIPSSFECESSTFQLSCNSDESISVTSALYGRRIGSSRCPGQNDHNTNCPNDRSLGIVRVKCNGRQTCSIQASNGVFDDPCVGTYKYLEIAYSCEGQCCPGCENGGTCTSPRVCECPDGYTGNRCETPVCLPECLHGGRCSAPNTCNCASGYGGQACELLTGVCPDDFTVPNDSGTNGASVTWEEVDLPRTLNVSSSHSSGDFFPIGITEVTYLFINDSISARCSFSVEVIDTELPHLDCPSDVATFADSGSTSLPVFWQPLTATDNSGNFSQIICGKINGSQFPIGVTPVTCNVRDYHGNNSTCTFQVHIKARCPDISTNTSVGILSWTQTLAEMEVESNERCPVNTERRNFGLASRQCIYNSTYGALWSTPIINTCGLVVTPNVEDLAQTQVDEHNVEEVAETLANITSINPGMESTETLDINAVQKAFTNIVNVGSSSQEVTQAVIEVVDHILSTNISSDESDDSSNSSSMVLKAIEQQVAQTLNEHGQFVSVQPNIVVEAFTVNASNIEEDVSFEVHFAEETRQKMVSTTTPPPTNQDVVSSIVLPSEALFNNKRHDADKATKVSFISYNDNKLFRSQKLQNQNSMTVVAGPIISAVVMGRNVKDLVEPVVVTIFPSKIKEVSPSVLNSSACVFWDFNENNGIGDWTQDGCYKAETSDGKVVCHCNHLTNFAVLVDIAGDNEETTFTLALDIISMIGCAFSIAALCLTLGIFILSRRLRQTIPRKILMHLCLSLLCLYLVFIVGIDSKPWPMCIAAAGLLHYFVLTTVFWMGVEARNMYINLVTVFEVSGSTFLRKAACIAWGVPLIPVAVTIGVKRMNYVADTYCFLTPGYGLYFGLLLPVGLVLLHNTITFLLVMRRLLRSSVGGNVKNSSVTLVSRRLRNALTISVLLGLTWLFGFLAINEARRLFQLLFCLFNSFQGVFVFVLFCLIQEDVRKVLTEHCQRKNPNLVAYSRSKKSESVTSAEMNRSMSLSAETGKLNTLSDRRISDEQQCMQTSNIFSINSGGNDAFSMI